MDPEKQEYCLWCQEVHHNENYSVSQSPKKNEMFEMGVRMGEEQFLKRILSTAEDSAAVKSMVMKFFNGVEVDKYSVVSVKIFYEECDTSNLGRACFVKTKVRFQGKYVTRTLLLTNRHVLTKRPKGSLKDDDRFPYILTVKKIQFYTDEDSENLYDLDVVTKLPSNWTTENVFVADNDQFYDCGYIVLGNSVTINGKKVEAIRLSQKRMKLGMTLHGVSVNHNDRAKFSMFEDVDGESESFFTSENHDHAFKELPRDKTVKQMKSFQDLSNKGHVHCKVGYMGVFSSQDLGFKGDSGTVLKNSEDQAQVLYFSNDYAFLSNPGLHDHLFALQDSFNRLHEFSGSVGPNDLHQKSKEITRRIALLCSQLSKHPSSLVLDLSHFSKVKFVRLWDIQKLTQYEVQRQVRVKEQRRIREKQKLSIKYSAKLAKEKEEVEKKKKELEIEARMREVEKREEEAKRREEEVKKEAKRREEDLKRREEEVKKEAKRRDEDLKKEREEFRKEQEELRKEREELKEKQRQVFGMEKIQERLTVVEGTRMIDKKRLTDLEKKVVIIEKAKEERLCEVERKLDGLTKRSGYGGENGEHNEE